MDFEHTQRGQSIPPSLLCTLSLTLAIAGAAVAMAQEVPDNGTPNAATGSQESESQTYLGNERIESCMQRWDPGTHMTKEAWRASCERIREEREPYVPKR